MARQPEDKRPHDLVGVLRDAESELTKEEVRAHGHVEKGSLASRVAVRQLTSERGGCVNQFISEVHIPGICEEGIFCSWLEGVP